MTGMRFEDASAIVHRALQRGVIGHSGREKWEKRIMRNPSAARELDRLAAAHGNYDDELAAWQAQQRDAIPRPQRPSWHLPAATASGLPVEALRDAPTTRATR